MKLLQLILLCLLAASCTKKVNDTFWVQVETDGALYAKVKTDKKYDLHLKNKDCFKKEMAIYKLLQINEFSFKNDLQNSAFLTIFKIIPQSVPYITSGMNYYSTFGDTLRYRPDVWMMRVYDPPDDWVKIEKISILGMDTISFSIDIFNHGDALKIPEPAINYLLEFAEQVEILELKERCTLCRRKKIPEFFKGYIGTD